MCGAFSSPVAALYVMRWSERMTLEFRPFLYARGIVLP